MGEEADLGVGGSHDACPPPSTPSLSRKVFVSNELTGEEGKEGEVRWAGLAASWGGGVPS